MDTRDRRSVRDLAELTHRKAKRDLAETDLRRAVQRAFKANFTQTDVAKVLQMSQPALSQRLKKAKTPEVPEGFSGAGPYEICQRYAAEEISREQLIDELARWPYTPIPQSAWLDDITPSPGPGSFREVIRAADEGLIDGATYDEVQRRRFPGVA